MLNVRCVQDIVSYNVQQARGDSDNLIAVLTSQKQIPLQTAVGQATEILRVQLQSFVSAANSSTKQTASQDEKRYIQGLRDCVAGWAHWVYETERYFQKNVEDVKEFGWVFLLPKENKDEGK